MLALIHHFVAASFAAGFAIEQAVGAEAHIELRLAVDTVLFAVASRFRLLALSANDLADSRLSGHG